MSILTEVIRLSDRWALHADRLQWMLVRWHGRSPGGEFRPVAFVATTKGVLLRCIEEEGTVVDDRGRVELATLPESFKSWRESVLARDACPS